MCTNKYQFQITKCLTIGLLVFIGTYLYLFGIPARSCLAQTLGLSISPPITEIMIIPGKEVTQTFTISNDGEDGMAKIYIIPFKAQGEDGNIILDENNIVAETSPYASWFKISSPVKNFGQEFYLGSGQTKNVDIQISPPETATEKDYYFTLLYEIGNDIPGGIAPIGPTNEARIGANMLISLSKDGNPQKNLNIVEFSAPKIIDSLGELNFNIRIGNYGFYVFNPEGQISIKPIIGSSETLNIAPFNVISNSIRKISCINGEEVISCQSTHKVLLGIYKSTLKIKTDNQDTYQEKTITTVAFPFSIAIAVFLIIFTYKIIKKNPKQGKESP